MKRSTARILSILCAIAAIVICCFFIPSGNKAAMIIVLLIYLPFGILLNYFQRCKHCGRWPHKGDFFIQYCPRCGCALDD